LAFPLPAGLRDLMPAEARRQAELARMVLGSFHKHGYELVSTPPFEYASVLEQEVGAADLGNLVRFVEPETGEVLAFRPDITPQIARVVATRFADAPLPARLCYEGSVVRRRLARARRDRQLRQAGVELVGLPGTAGDLETVRVACAAVSATGLTDFTVDLGHAMIAASLLSDAPREARDEVVEALTVKDPDGVRKRAEAAGIRGRTLEALVLLPSLWGEPAVFDEARSVLSGTAAAPHVAELEALTRSVVESGMAPKVVVDLGEIWSFSYYTGFMMRLLAHGPGESVASGGRYDRLYDRFGSSRPASGAAIDLGNLAWAIVQSGVPLGGAQRVLLHALTPDRDAVLAALRDRGIDCAWAPAGDAAAYAAAWRYGHVLSVDGGKWTLAALSEAQPVVLDVAGTAALADRVVTVLNEGRARSGV
jgi:ATP phosphoribosyltransferase regulatory subunit